MAAVRSVYCSAAFIPAIKCTTCPPKIRLFALPVPWSGGNRDWLWFPVWGNIDSRAHPASLRRWLCPGEAWPFQRACMEEARLPLNAPSAAPAVALPDALPVCLPSGGNCLFFGCRNKAKDFYCQAEWEGLVERGLLALFVAFSRDQVNPARAALCASEPRMQGCVSLPRWASRSQSRKGGRAGKRNRPAGPPETLGFSSKTGFQPACVTGSC